MQDLRVLTPGQPGKSILALYRKKRCQLLSEQLKVRLIFFLSILITFLAHLFFVWTQIESGQAGDAKSEHRHSRNQQTKMDWNGCI